MRFIEYMPFSGNQWSTGKFIPYQAMLAQIMERWPHLTRKQDARNDTSKVRTYTCGWASGCGKLSEKLIVPLHTGASLLFARY